MIKLQTAFTIFAIITCAALLTSVNSALRNTVYVVPDEPIPDFSSFTNVKDKKQAFFSYILPMVNNTNRTIIKKRERLIDIAKKLQQDSISNREQIFLSELAKAYKLDPDKLSSEEQLGMLLTRVDVIPPSLALAQAAKESGWGTSRFAQDANNLFGQWCYTQGCGLIPKQRPSGATHEVKKFASVSNAIDAYINNLNTNRAYEKLRVIRSQLREKNNIDGAAMAEGLEKYSQRGQKYISEVKSLIIKNDLRKFDSTIPSES